MQRDRLRDKDLKEPVKFITDLSSLELLMMKQLAVYRLAILLRGQYSVEQLTAFIQIKAVDLFTKIFGMVRKRKADYACFGQPLHVAVEKTGVDSQLGSCTGTLKIPRVVEETVAYLELRGELLWFY